MLIFSENNRKIEHKPNLLLFLDCEVGHSLNGRPFSLRTMLCYSYNQERLYKSRHTRCASII